MKRLIQLCLVCFLSLNAFGQILFEEHAIVESQAPSNLSYSADLDGDSDMDVIAVSDQQIVWYENVDGLGTFGDQQMITTNTDGVISVYTADLDGDGDLDVLSASINDDKIAWYENEDGLGTFGDQQIITTYTDQLRYVHAGDLDSDGDMDVLSASHGDGKIAWYENLDGAGTFGGQQIISSQGSASFIQAVDLDGDEDLDIIFAAGSKLAWFENENGLANWSLEKVISNWETITSVYLKDLDSDSDLDILYTTVDYTEENAICSISWHENGDGNGTFNLKQTFYQTSSWIFIHYEDVDNDGDVDVLSTSNFNNELSWHENTDGQGTFSGQQILISDNPRAFHATDFNGDGNIDMLFISANTITWYNHLDSLGTFAEPQNIHAPAFVDLPTSVHIADLNGDGNKDVLSASFSDDKIAWYENEDGLGTLEAQHIISTNADGTQSVFAADLDGDGDIDALSASYYDNKIAWYENEDGLGTFGEQQIISTNADGAQFVFAADLDNDGDMDVLSASRNDDKIAWYENDGSGNFGAQQIITIYANGARAVSAADIDGDGDLDVLSASYNDDKIAWYENEDGLGNFGAQQIITTSANGATSVYTADLDNDGDMDVLSSSRGNNKIAWYENEDGLGNFGVQQIITTTVDRASSVFAADLDADGDLDVLSTSTDDNKIAWYENEDGLGNFGAQQIITTDAIGANAVYVEDLDNDGDLDIISSAASDDKIAWYENLGADTEAPIANCQNITIALDENGLADVIGANLDNESSDDFGIESFEPNLNQLSCAHIGGNNITLTITDLGGNVDSCMAIVTVVDDLPPAINTKNIIVDLTADNTVIISPEQVNNGSVDNCTITEMTLDQNTFSAVGEYTVTLSIVDDYNNTSTKDAIVTVVDDLTAPVANCKDVSIVLDGNEMASITAIDLDNESTDNYLIESYAIDQQDFTCDHVGANNVQLTITDIGGNTDFCTAIVTVIDDVPPVVLYQPFFFNLEGASEITITVDDIDQGSYDNCGIAEKSLSQTTFTSSGEYVVVLTVTDLSNNVSTRNVNVEIIDDLEPPIANCQDITVELKQSGLVSISALNIDNGSTDDFNIEFYGINQYVFYCEDIGENEITLIVTDELSNTDACTAIVTVVDNKSPTVNTQAITIDLAGQSSISITPDQVDYESSDNCEITYRGLDEDTFTEVGEYEVELTIEDASGNSDSGSAIVTVINSMVATDDLDLFNKNLNIHPIPTTDQITIEAPNNIAQINIYNTQGQLLISETTNNVSISNINLTNLAAGLYFCEVRDNEGNIGVRKVIKK